MEKKKHIPIEDASKEQLQAFATLFGLEVDGRASPDNLRIAIMEAGYSRDTIPDLTSKTTQSRSAGRVSRQVVWNKDHRACFCIMLQTREGKRGDQPVPIGVNGNHILVPRGKPVPLPIEHVLVLENAVQRVPDTDANGKIVRWVEVPSFPFQYVDVAEVDPALLAAEDFEPSEAQQAFLDEMIEAAARNKKAA